MIKRYLSRPSVWGTIVAIAVIAVVAFAYFYPEASQGDVLRQHDMQQGAAIGHEAQLYEQETGHAPRWTNALFSGMPTFQISPSYPSNALFSWINTVMGLGLPSPSNLLAMMMIGFLILGLSMKMRWYVALLGAIAYGLSSYFVIIIGAGHIWKFITLAYIPPTIAGIVLAYRGKYLAGGALAALFAMLQIAGNHVQMTYYFLFVIAGFVIVALIDAIRRHQMRRWAIATASLAVAAILAVGANSPSLYNTYEYSKETMRGNHSELTDPTAQANDPNRTDGLNRDYITQYSYGRSETFTLLIPDVKGGASMRPVKGQNQMLTLADLPEAGEMAAKGTLDPAAQQYIQWIGQYFGEPEGTSGPVYVGALICALFLLGCIIVKGPAKWMLIILTILSILLALGRNCMWLTDLMIDHMPMYSRFRTPESILVIAEFTMPLMAMLALQRFISLPSKEAWERYRKPLFISFGITLAICLAGIFIPAIFGSPVTDTDRQTDAYLAEALAQQGATAEQAYALSLSNPTVFTAVSALREGMVRADSLRSFLIVAAGLIILFLYARQKMTAALAAILAAIVIFGDLFLADKRYLSGDAFVPRLVAGPEPFPLTATDRQIMADTTSHYRVMDIPQFQGAAPSYRHKAIGGYHAAKLTRYQDLIDRHLGHFQLGAPTEADFRVVDMLNGRYYITPEGEAVYNPDALGNAWFVSSLSYVDDANAEMEALSTLDPATEAVADKRFATILGNPAPADSTDNIRLTTYAPDRLTYSATTAGGALAVFSEVFFPWGWQATIDGNPVEIGRVNYLLRALPIPAGHHTIVMTFDPQSLHTTASLATISIILIYLALAASLLLWVKGVAAKPKEEGKTGED
ncbi:MAG: YfhO family protein [Pseudoflavonifractor sp.]|nr:YfhO family protein [Alloprevotella sp.]MCM1117503.1 YfhO family protein [Pseudoflavonifractor sp.]